MSLTASPSDDWARPLFERQVAMLGQLAEAGLEMAMAVRDQAASAPDASACTAYARIARAVRLTLILQTRAIKDLQAHDRQVATGASCEAANAKVRLERIVGRIAEDQTNDADEVERLVEEARDRLDYDDIYGDVLARPVSDLVTEICRDLGLDPDWSALAQEAWAMEAAALPSPSMGEGPGMGVNTPRPPADSQKAVSTQPPAGFTPSWPPGCRQTAPPQSPPPPDG